MSGCRDSRCVTCVVCDLSGLLRPMFHLSVPVNTDLCDAFHKSPNEAQSRWQASQILYVSSYSGWHACTNLSLYKFVCVLR